MRDTHVYRSGGAAVRAWVFVTIALGACAKPGLDAEALKDPASCQSCHPNQYREWSGSMHAYASIDPIFRAWNQRGQRETGGALGDFCVKCHAPMAVIDGLTTDGLNLDALPSKYQGVGCYFCHSVERVDGTHNNPLVLSDDETLRGGIPDPLSVDAHDAAYDPLFDRNRLESASLCGSCHDIVNGHGVHLERTYLEWQRTLYAKESSNQRQTCGQCHMPSREDIAADVPGVPLRRVHDHSMPAVDVALIEFPERESQRQSVQRLLDTALYASLCVLPVADGMQVTVQVENFAAGHGFPSGATQDRRVWVELVAYLGSNVVYESGTIGEAETVKSLAARDPDLWWFGDQLFGEDGAPVHDFWAATRYEGLALPGPTSNDPLDPAYVPTHLQKVYEIPDFANRITLKLRMRPLDHDVLDMLIEGGDLREDFGDPMPTFDLGATVLEWRSEEGKACVPF